MLCRPMYAYVRLITDSDRMEYSGCHCGTEYPYKLKLNYTLTEVSMQDR